MLVLHVYIMGKHGNIERTYDFLRNDNKEELEGCDLVIPYDKEIRYPMSESQTIDYMSILETKGDH